MAGPSKQSLYFIRKTLSPPGMPLSILGLYHRRVHVRLRHGRCESTMRKPVRRHPTSREFPTEYRDRGDLVTKLLNGCLPDLDIPKAASCFVSLVEYLIEKWRK